MTARILIIEDNPANLELAKYLLEAAGHTVLTAHNGEEGIALAQCEHPDMVLSDLRMPVMDGFEVLRRIRADEALRDIPVIAVTAFSMPDDRHIALLAGFEGYMSKPIFPESFVQQLEAFLPEALRASKSKKD